MIISPVITSIISPVIGDDEGNQPVLPQFAFGATNYAMGDNNWYWGDN